MEILLSTFFINKNRVLKNPNIKTTRIMSKKMEAFKRKLAEKRKAQNDVFLAENQLRENVTVLGSGIQYEVVEEGFGKVHPSIKDWVTAHYHGTLIDGKVLRSLVIRKVKKGGFHEYMKSIGKFGGQNKIPQLSDNRKIADVLQDFLIE